MGCRHLFRPRRTLDLDLNVSGNLDNLGTLAGRQLVSLTADNLNNLGGRIAGKALDIATLRDFTLQGGSLDADDQLAVRAGRNINIASLHVNNPGGTLQLAANGDIGLLAAYLINNAPTAAGQPATTTRIDAGHNLTLGTVTTAYAEAVGDGKHARQESGRKEIGSTIATTGDITLTAGNNLTARAADVSSSAGAILARAGNDLLIEAGEASTASAEQHKYKSKGFLSSSKTTTRDTSSDTTAIASTFSGDSTTLIADRDIAIKGSNVVATNDTTLIATRNLSIEAAAESHTETHYSKTKQSGVFSSGGVGFTIGSKQNSTDQKTDATLAARSTVGSTDGNVLLLAGETYKQVGSDVIAAKGNIDIAAKTVDIKEARETSRTTTETKSKQSGFTVAFTNPVITAVQTAQPMSDAAKDTSDPRMKALAAASTGLAGYNAYTALEAGQGKTVDGVANQIPVLNDKGEVADYRDATAADKMGGVGINLSIGGSKSSSTTTQSSDTAAVSNLTAGRDIRVEASGAGEQSDVTLQGTNATAARNLTLTAEDEIRLLAAKNTSDQHSTNKNSSASVGIGFMVGGTQNGFTIQAGVSGGKGKADGQDVRYSNTHVEAGQTLTLESGGNTTMKGAVAKGEKVKADIGKDLLIESLQDTSTYDSKQKSLGVSVSLCIPPFCVGTSSGSVSASNSKIESDYASVTEQSAIRAGDQGFQVAVKNDTELKGGTITSTQQAIDDNLNRFETGGELTLSDIQNKAEYSAKSMSVNIGTGFSAAGKLVPGGTSAGFGKDGDKAESMTLAAISDIAGNTAARTGDAETGIAKIFDQEKVQKEIDAQTRITQQFGQLAPEAWGKHANTKFADALKTGDEEGMRCWGPDGACRAGGHAVLGGLAGGVGGAVGAGFSSVAAPHVQAYLVDQGLPPAAASAVTQLAAIGAGSAVGGTAGATGALNEASNNALILAVPLAAEIMAGGAVAIRACVMSPACQKAVMLAGVATLDKMVSMLPPEEQSLVPGYGGGKQPSPAGPLVTPLPDPKKMQELYGTPPLQNPEQLRSWLANALEGYPADEAEKWARDLIRTFPAAEQLRYSDLVLQAARDSASLRNGHLAGGAHPVTGIPFDRSGYPDFSGAAIAEAKITQTGSRAGDFRAANDAVGINSTPEGYTWHHHQDGETMQLVPREIHAKTGHTGGFKSAGSDK